MSEPEALETPAHPGDGGGEGSEAMPETSDGEMAAIPVRNWWHILLYAWNLVDFIGRDNLIPEDAPEVHELLIWALTEAVRGQLRRGLRGEYVERSELLKGVRGRIDFAGTLRELALFRGELRCDYEEHSLNVPRNQIIVSTLVRSLQRKLQWGTPGGTEKLENQVKRLVRLLADVNRIPLTPRLIACELQKVGSNEREYLLILRICEMLLELQMPLEDGSGSSMLKWDELAEKSKIYERFVLNFYRKNMDNNEWAIHPQSPLRWNHPPSETWERQDELRLPSMNPDIQLVYRPSRQRIIIDTKWYKKVAAERYGSESVHSSNLYQMYAYLASQDHLGGPHKTSTGILLYAQTKQGARKLRTQIDDHPFWVHTLDLSQEWQQIETDLRELIQGAKFACTEAA